MILPLLEKHAMIAVIRPGSIVTNCTVAGINDTLLFVAAWIRY
ncbi:MAG: hypothetical protein H6Q75_571 [Firmicutes bacterium]|nr:hypothetical protein [Bacillota bacterium]